MDIKANFGFRDVMLLSFIFITCNAYTCTKILQYNMYRSVNKATMCTQQQNDKVLERKTT